MRFREPGPNSGHAFAPPSGFKSFAKSVQYPIIIFESSFSSAVNTCPSFTAVWNTNASSAV